MHDYLLSTEVVRFAFMFGVAVSMLLYERRHLTTGSIVVPGYIATFIVYPLVIVATFVNALVSYAIVNKLLRRWFLLYGRTKFTVLAIVSILIQTAMLKFTPSGPWLWESDFKLFVGVGYVVPALVAHDMGRQGIKKTTKSVLLAAAIVAAPIALALAFDVPGINDLAPLRGGGEMAISPGWIPFAVLLSAGAAWGVATNYGFRSGGFVGAAFVGMLLGDPWQVVFAGGIAAVTYVIVTRFLMGSMILFGRRKFSSMLLVSSSLSWILLWVGTEVFGDGARTHFDLGSLALTPLFIPGLLANDSQRTSPRHVACGLAMATSFVLSTTWWVQSLFEGSTLALGWKLLAVASFAAIFWRQFVPARTAARQPAGASTGTVAAPAPIEAAIAFGRAGFQRWADLHRDAATAAERWLEAVLGERDAAPLAASRSGATPAAASDDATEAAVERVRRAAIRALAAERTLAAAAPGAATTPTIGELPRRPRPDRTAGEFDSVAADIAAGVGRPRPLPRRRTATTTAHRTAGGTDPRTAEHTTPAGLPRRSRISEPPGAAPQRAHTAAPGARYTDSSDTAPDPD